MTQAILIRDELAPLRDWLRAHATFDTSPANQVYVGGLPTGIDGESVVLNRVGGTNSGPVDLPLIQFDVRADTGSACAALAAELKSLLVSTPASTALTSTLHFMGATVESDVWSPDQPGDTPRRVITAEVAVKSLP